MIQIKENGSRAPSRGRNSQPQRVHEIYGIMTDKEGSPINNSRQTQCKKAFKNGSLRITMAQGMIIVSIRDKDNEDNYNECFKLQAELPDEKYFFVSANSGKAINNHHYLYSIKAVDLDEKIDRQEYEKSQKQGQEFVMKGQDVLHAKADHFSNVNMTIESYNRQLLRQTNLYSKALSSFIKNQEKQQVILDSLPKDSTINSIHISLLDQYAKLSQTDLIMVQNKQTIQNQLQIVESMSALHEQKARNLDRFQNEQIRLQQELTKIMQSLDGFNDVHQKDKLVKLIQRRNNILGDDVDTSKYHKQRDYVIQQKLQDHIGVKVKQSHDKIKQQLGEDDIVDYILLVILIAVAVIGFTMWKKIKEQAKNYIL